MGSNTEFLLAKWGGVQTDTEEWYVCKVYNGEESLSGEKALTGSQSQLNEKWSLSN